MTTTEIRWAPVAARHAVSRAHTVIPVAAAAGGVTLAIRLALHGRSFDVFGDEVVYTDLGRSVVNGGFPRLAGPFFLHGPGFFYLEAGWQRLLGDQPGVIAQVYQMRTLNALLAAATGVALVLLAARAGTLRAGVAAGALFALDPFCIRQNDRVLLETAMMLWVTLGYLVLSALIGRRPSRGDWRRAVGAGLLFGCAVLTKDEGALLTAAPLLAAAALRWGPRRTLTLLTVATTAAVYAAYVAVVAANGEFSQLWQAKTVGVRRMLGLIQATGFHSSGGGSLPARLIAEAGFFGTTYAALAVAGPAVLILLRRGSDQQRMLGLFYCAAAAALGYALVLGTLEEQELYLLVIPSLLAIPVAVTRLHDGRPARQRPVAAPRHQGWLAPAAAWVLLLALGLNLVTCAQWLRQPDDGFVQLARYMAVHVPAGTRVGATEVDIETPNVLGGQFRVGFWETPAALSREHVGYLVVEWASVDEGYADQTPAQVRRLIGHGRLVFSFRGRTYGQLALYRLRRPPSSPA
jgi:Dolichyl-phosphate-mannose-protein mannosyltransferase